MPANRLLFDGLKPPKLCKFKSIPVFRKHKLQKIK